jgi:hypothetical protein
MPVNESSAEAFASGIADGATRNLVLLGIAVARLRFVKSSEMGDLEWREGLPKGDFDLHFFATVLAAMFSRREVIEAILSGRSVEEATGWDL